MTFFSRQYYRQYKMKQYEITFEEIVSKYHIELPDDYIAG